jgi:hypothetical protein
MKVHHEGFIDIEPEYLAAATGVPGMRRDIEMSDMYRASSNGLNGEAPTAENTA